MEENEKEIIQLPENAFTELKDGEQYEPVMNPKREYPEVNAWSVTWGIVMAMLFSAAAAYLGLKVGQVFEAAIPSPLSLWACQPLRSAIRLSARMSSSRVSVPARALLLRGPSSRSLPSTSCRPSIRR